MKIRDYQTMSRDFERIQSIADYYSEHPKSVKDNRSQILRLIGELSGSISMFYLLEDVSPIKNKLLRSLDSSFLRQTFKVVK